MLSLRELSLFCTEKSRRWATEEQPSNIYRGASQKTAWGSLLQYTAEEMPWSEAETGLLLAVDKKALSLSGQSSQRTHCIKVLWFKTQLDKLPRNLIWNSCWPCFECSLEQGTSWNPLQPWRFYDFMFSTKKRVKRLLFFVLGLPEILEIIKNWSAKKTIGNTLKYSCYRNMTMWKTPRRAYWRERSMVLCHLHSSIILIHTKKPSWTAA